MTYRASWDTSVKVITVGITILFIGIMFVPLLKGEFDIPFLIIGGMMEVVIYVAAYLFAPVSYSLDNEKLTIHRPFKDVTINRSQIAKVQVLDKGALKFTIRTFGVGGLFGYYGQFYNSHFGKMTWYATRMDRVVLIKTVGNKNLILTPDDTNDFVGALEQEPSFAS